MRQPLVAGNWKLNGSYKTIVPLVSGLKSGVESASGVEVAICPPFVYLADVAALLEKTEILLGAQDVSEQESGAYTGEISAQMLADVGCRYVIVGHSERRHIYNESDELTAQKFAKAAEAGLSPILCLGEKLDEREQGITEEVVARQLDSVVQLTGIAGFEKAVIAYEPVWAIGTGKTATPEQAQEVHAFIRERISSQSVDVADGIRILYGGSVKPDNAKEIFSQADVDGGLIGGASLKVDDFLQICNAI